ncbi:uncharacterized protein C2orf15 homolog [Nannospalax galili]|uniref:uncharacterized protein C2orf15 homolog n=1 Tax=Nannospalax galili TaxID=1026970 RepID=UPI000819F693|nr:uncharacterized protein C2orf15 homolog [Nannospalax galili]
MALWLTSILYSLGTFIFFSNQIEETFPQASSNSLGICSPVPMGFLLSKASTQISAIQMDSKVDDHLMQETEKNRLEPVTRLFQDTKKIIFEDINQENFTRIEGTDTGSLSLKTLNSVVYVKENDGLVITDLE